MTQLTLMGKPIVYCEIEKENIDSIVFGDFAKYGSVRIPIVTQNSFNHFCKSMKADEFNLLEFANFCRQRDESITDLQARQILKLFEHVDIIKYTGLLHWKINGKL